MRTIAVGMTLAIALPACGGPDHVQLAPLPPQLTPAERVAKFNRLRPVKEGTITENGEKVDNWLVLADKTEVGYPEDLAPVLDENSDTMRIARASASLRKRGHVTGVIATVLVFGGLGLAGISEQIDGHIAGQPWLSLTMIGTGLITGLFSRHYSREDFDLRRKAFATYPRDLGARLNVCAHGLEVVACEAPLDTPLQPPSMTSPAPPVQ